MSDIKICPVCKSPFPINSRYGKKKKYCSIRCKTIYNRQMEKERTKERKLMKDGLAYDSTKAIHMGLSYGQWMAIKEGRC